MKRLEFPEIDDIDVVFGGYPQKWFDSVLAIQEEKGDKKYEDIASKIFFSGGTVPVDQNLPKEYISKGLRILKAVLGSFTPEHEHKEKVCGLIIKSLSLID
jgi:hypothetical protein